MPEVNIKIKTESVGTGAQDAEKSIKGLGTAANAASGKMGSYEGANPEGGEPLSSEEDQTTYELDVTQAMSPISQHPRIKELETKYGERGVPEGSAAAEGAEIPRDSEPEHGRAEHDQKSNEK